MKKLLFLLACTLLLLVATATPALAATPIFYFVDYDGVYAIDRDNQTFWLVDTVPPHSDVRIGHTWGFLGRGGATSIRHAYVDRLDVYRLAADGSRSRIDGYDASVSGDNWHELDMINEWTGPGLPFIPANPNAIAAGIWVRWYYFGLDQTKMEPGNYAAVVTSTMTRTWANPMWAVEPGLGRWSFEGWWPGAGRQSSAGWDWEEYDWNTFTVE